MATARRCRICCPPSLAPRVAVAPRAPSRPRTPTLCILGRGGRSTHIRQFRMMPPGSSGIWTCYLSVLFSRLPSMVGSRRSVKFQLQRIVRNCQIGTTTWYSLSRRINIGLFARRVGTVSRRLFLLPGAQMPINSVRTYRGSTRIAWRWRTSCRRGGTAPSFLTVPSGPRC